MNTQPENEMSLLALANVEALAGEQGVFECETVAVDFYYEAAYKYCWVNGRYTFDRFWTKSVMKYKCGVTFEVYGSCKEGTSTTYYDCGLTTSEFEAPTKKCSLF